MSPQDPKTGSADENPGAGENLELDEFFQRLPANFRWPKPTAEAVAAAVEAIQRMSSSGAEEPAGDSTSQSTAICSNCGQSHPPTARFCGFCGAPLQGTAAPAATGISSPAGGQHHYHHHYHHFVSAQASGVSAGPAETASSGPKGKASSGPAGSRAETAVRQVVQDWAQACNTKHLDDLLELYTSDATVIRSSLPPVRSLPAIREFLFSLLEAGLGDVEMESLRTDVLGEVAIDLGRCKMLVPVAMGKRREDRGKYLIVLVRQPSGTWKILADTWSSDLAVSAPVATDSARKGSEAVVAPRKPR